MTRKAITETLARFTAAAPQMGTAASGASRLLIYLLHRFANIYDGQSLEIPFADIRRALGCTPRSYREWKQCLIDANIVEADKQRIGTTTIFRILCESVPSQCSDSTLTQCSDNTLTQCSDNTLTQCSKGTIHSAPTTPCHSAQKAPSTPYNINKGNIRVLKEEEKNTSYSKRNAEAKAVTFDDAAKAMREALLSPENVGWREISLSRIGVKDCEVAAQLFLDHVRVCRYETKFTGNTVDENLRWLVSVARQKIDTADWKDARLTAAERAKAKPYYIARMERRPDGLYVLQYNDQEVIKVPDNTPPPPKPGSRWYRGQWI